MSKGFNLNLKNSNVMTFEQENELFAGQSIKLNFKLGDKQFDLEFKVGQDVEWAKKCVAEQLDCGRNDFDLIFEEKVMPEFFSLNDIPNLKDQSSIQIRMKI
ncbi:unnamed protein product (macronuclear) [Paramecium tetraurelia]|uniref:Ubiquitin-like domain-containing protein n=2 Tax=Paramecium TaxID=5884 RepID=A0CJV1_PARTE|nr:uncharacterized protein GSPATT00000780001 [Paramecium tetraurelia]CAD8134029.1 unnamed protein product [Paramecium octaurelia]CAK71068.1 unnamed protein product [Paramecium tetraurelia]|eukprot:XP_001438465.1 hypothetical protein (macronuclear) [Paramecium tetraurelia strain d4-2]